ncbi:MAG: DUF2461 domain-containing protein [Gammaproteobacteria bacterium]|nr:DUF2461 domain-containing protein [Gammaproteobacteria bacterium]MBQ0839291.1 DUF2461 domain-containing protein [Gammaproteobacteria bacterium]
MSDFKGFSPQLLSFLDELTVNNNRLWFGENKQRYEDAVLSPALSFVEHMACKIEKLSPYFEAIPKRSGGSLMRVYRDTRFSKDKTPYKTNLGIQFRHRRGKDIHAPGYYLHIQRNEVFLGVGCWRPDASSLAKIRQRIVDKPEAWRAIVDKPSFKRQLAWGGDSLKRPPRGYSGDHPLIDSLKRKDFIVIKTLDDAALENEDFTRQVVKVFRAGEPLMRFLCEALEIGF